MKAFIWNVFIDLRTWLHKCRPEWSHYVKQRALIIWYWYILMVIDEALSVFSFTNQQVYCWVRSWRRLRQEEGALCSVNVCVRVCVCVCVCVCVYVCPLLLCQTSKDAPHIRDQADGDAGRRCARWRSPTKQTPENLSQSVESCSVCGSGVTECREVLGPGSGGGPGLGFTVCAIVSSGRSSAAEPDWGAHAEGSDFLMKQEIMAEGPRCKRRKQANPRRKNGKTALTHITRNYSRKLRASPPGRPGVHTKHKVSNGTEPPRAAVWWSPDLREPAGWSQENCFSLSSACRSEAPRGALLPKVQTDTESL